MLMLSDETLLLMERIRNWFSLYQSLYILGDMGRRCVFLFYSEDFLKIICCPLSYILCYSSFRWPLLSSSASSFTLLLPVFCQSFAHTTVIHNSYKVFFLHWFQRPLKMTENKWRKQREFEGCVGCSTSRMVHSWNNRSPCMTDVNQIKNKISSSI